MRSQNEIIFQLALVSIINEVNAGINLLVLYLGKQRNARMPMLWRITDEITGGGRLVANRFDAGGRVGAKQVHSHDRLSDMRSLALVSVTGCSFRRRITDRAQRK